MQPSRAFAASAPKPTGRLVTLLERCFYAEEWALLSNHHKFVEVSHSSSATDNLDDIEQLIALGETILESLRTTDPRVRSLLETARWQRLQRRSLAAQEQSRPQQNRA